MGNKKKDPTEAIKVPGWIHREIKVLAAIEKSTLGDCLEKIYLEYKKIKNERIHK